MAKKHITRIFASLLIMSFANLFSGCGRSAEKELVLASVGNTEITVSDFNERIANLPVQYRDVVRKRRSEYLQELINDTLLYQEAIRRGMHKEKDVRGVIEEATRKILAARLLKDEVNDNIVITEEDITEFYDNNKEKYMTPEIMRVSHILVPSREEAEAILEELSDGKSFEDMARAKSVDPTAQRGGDIGYFPKGQLMPEFDRACSGLQVNEISGAVRTKLGYHLIKLTDRRAPELRPVGSVSEDIEARLRTVKRQKLFNELLEKLREKSDIEINGEALYVQEDTEGQAPAKTR